MRHLDRHQRRGSVDQRDQPDFCQIDDRGVGEGWVRVRPIVARVDGQERVGPVRVGVGARVGQKQVGLRQQVRLQAGDAGQDGGQVASRWRRKGRTRRGDDGRRMGPQRVEDRFQHGHRRVRRVRRVRMRAGDRRDRHHRRRLRHRRDRHRRRLRQPEVLRRPLPHGQRGPRRHLRQRVQHVRLRTGLRQRRRHLRHRDGVLLRRDRLHHRLEPVLRVRRVSHRADAPVRVHERVLRAKYVGCR